MNWRVQPGGNDLRGLQASPQIRGVDLGQTVPGNGVAQPFRDALSLRQATCGESTVVPAPNTVFDVVGGFGMGDNEEVFHVFRNHSYLNESACSRASTHAKICSDVGAMPCST